MQKNSLEKGMATHSSVIIPFLIKLQKGKSMKLPMGEYEEILGEGMKTQRPFLHTSLSVHLFHLAILL